VKINDWKQGGERLPAYKGMKRGIISRKSIGRGKGKKMDLLIEFAKTDQKESDLVPKGEKPLRFLLLGGGILRFFPGLNTRWRGKVVRVTKKREMERLEVD